MYKGRGCLFLYLLALAMLVLGASCQVDWTVGFMALLFLVWDAGFIFSWDIPIIDGKNSFQGRNTEEILSHCRDAETLMSYFIGFYAAVLAVVFSASKPTTFLDPFPTGWIRMCLVGGPLVLAAFPMLFIPVQFGKKKDETDPKSVEEIAPSVKMLLFVNIYCEKLVVFTFVHDLLRISRHFFLK